MGASIVLIYSVRCEYCSDRHDTEDIEDAKDFKRTHNKSWHHRQMRKAIKQAALK